MIPQSATSSRLRIAAITIVIMVLSAIVFLLAEQRAREKALLATRAAAMEMSATHAGLLASELQRYRLLPLVLAEDRDVRSALRGSTEVRSRVNRKLEQLAAATDAAVIYLLDARGDAIAASNWQLSTSFVGHDYGFRSYFTEALAAGHAEQFALGAVSRRPGLFLARRAVAGDVLGVIVVKVEFGGVEREWGNQPGLTLVSDASGLVALTNRADLRFAMTVPLSGPAKRRAEHQFGWKLLVPLPLELRKDAATATDGTRFVAGIADVPIPGWQLRYFEPLGPLERAALAETRIALLVGVGLLSLMGALFLRARERRMLQSAVRMELEAQVRSRTSELHATNLRLLAQSREREQADQRLREANDALAQANRLASIGQITAGVAHEINQPVAAIQTFSESAATFLARGEQEKVNHNLGRIVELTGRIGRITAELRSFARRGVTVADNASAITIRSSLDGALLLIGDRIRSSGAVVDRAGEEDLVVIADRMRVEQILINLVQNALDAVAGRNPSTIVVRTRLDSGRVRVTIADDGPGLDPAIVDTAFTPFATTKRHGLGLGLGIARDIAREMGGELRVTDSPLCGAAFELELRCDG